MIHSLFIQGDFLIIYTYAYHWLRYTEIEYINSFSCFCIHFFCHISLKSNDLFYEMPGFIFFKNK